MTKEIAIPEGLNEGQKNAYLKMCDYVNGELDGTMFLLEGYAGTGKTFLIGKLIEYILKDHPHWSIAVTAPTNKAVKVLRKSSLVTNYNVKFSTIHKLLGLKEVITDSGLQLFQNDNFDVVDIKDYEVVIIDEVSMLNDELFLELDRYNKDVKIIFCGDPLQIPPVNKVDCIPFLPEERIKYKIEMCLLSEIMRQKVDNPIIEHSFVIRKNITESQYPTDNKNNLNDKGSGIVYYLTSNDLQKELFLEQLKNYFTCNKFKDNSDYSKLIAWRNKTVSEMNSIIRKMIYGEVLTKIMLGEKLIANKPIVDNRNNIQFTTNDEFEVVEFTTAIDSNHKCKYYNTKVKSINVNGREEIDYIRILHEDSEEDFNTKAKYLKDIAIKTKRKFEWKMYYNFLRVFADTTYNYAITSHKAQGSTYSNVFLLEDDINCNQNIIERNRIKYTASTRPTDKLFIVKK